MLHIVPDGTFTEGLTEGLREKNRRPLGLTIYRTDYDSPDQIWELLLQRLDVDLKEEVSYTFQDSQHILKEKEATDKLLALVQIDGRSDATVLNNRTMGQLRIIFKDHTGGSPLNADNSVMQYFLLADAEVLEAASRGEYWVKIVQVHYDEKEFRPHPTRFTGKQDYFGWMKVATRSLLYIRTRLEDFDLPEILDQVRAANRNPSIEYPVLDKRGEMTIV